MGSDFGQRWRDAYRYAISIHAPAWGATKTKEWMSNLLLISIHAPAWGATIHKYDIMITLTDFNPRSRMGSDGFSFAGKQLNLFQSTLPHGERQNHVAGFFGDVSISIHAPAWGAPPLQSGWKLEKIFQSTLPHGERRAYNIIDIAKYQGISIHAPAWGATHEFVRSQQTEGNFNPRSRMGSDSPARAADKP